MLELYSYFCGFLEGLAAFKSFIQHILEISQFSYRNKGFFIFSPTEKTHFRAVLHIFRASTSPWDNRNRFVSKKIMKNYRKWVRFLRENLISAEAVYAGWLAGGNFLKRDGGEWN